MRSGTPDSSHPEPSLATRVREELREYAIVAAYLYVCFGAVLFYDAAAQRAEGFDLLPHGLALVKALILGKFILLGEAMGIGRHVRAATLAWSIAVRTGLLFLVLVVLKVIEELVVGFVHGRSVVDSLLDFEGHSALVLLAHCVLMLVILIPLVAAKEISRALGEGVLKTLLFGGPDAKH